MRNLFLFTVLLFSASFAGAAFTEGNCLQHYPDFAVKEAPADRDLAEILENKKLQSTACRDGNRQYLLIPHEQTALYVDDPIIPIEIFKQIPLAKKSRELYQEQIHERAGETIQAALSSGKIEDKEVLRALKWMESRIFIAGMLPIATRGDTKDCLIKGVSKVFAYVDPDGDLLKVYLCRKGYGSESPHTVIHEYTHLFQVDEDIQSSMLADECFADLVAMMATAAAAKAGVIHQAWDFPGSYFSRGSCKKTAERYNAFKAKLDLQ